MPQYHLTAKPWERQHNESSPAFEAFSIYRDMGGERSLRAVSQKLDKSYTIIGRWSARWEWVERIRAYENELTRQAREQAVKEVKEMRKRQTQTAVIMQQKAVAALRSVDPDKLDYNTIVRFITEGAKLESGNRLDEAGLNNPPALFGIIPKGTQDAIDSGLDWSKITTDDLEKLAKLGGDDE